jgi:small GTP-binding protein
MTSVQVYFRELPEPLRAVFEDMWRTLTPEQQKEVEGLLKGLPFLAPDLIKRVIDLVARTWIVGERRRIAIVGPANVGKSTLYNYLISNGEDRAEVSDVPGTTRVNQSSDAGLFTVVDTPGADAVGPVGDLERQRAYSAAGSADFLIIMFEATRNVKRAELELYDDLVRLNKPFVVLLNKMDLVAPRARGEVLEVAARNLRLETQQVIPTIAKDRKNLDRVLLTIALADKRAAPAIADAFPTLRARLAQGLIVRAASAAALIALAPLPFMDLIPLFAMQAGLVVSIARIYGFRITPGRAKELVATFGLGLLARTVFQEVAKLGGVPGWLLASSIAASTTVAIGYAAEVWFAHGERPSQEVLRKTIEDVSAHLRAELTDLGQLRPPRERLRGRITRVLQDLLERLRPHSTA